MTIKRHFSAFAVFFLLLSALSLVACTTPSISGPGNAGSCEHRFGNWTVKEEATCTKAGEKFHTCTLCGERQTETIPASGHDFKNYVPDGNATCEADGTKTATCERCDATDTVTDEDSALGHSFLHYSSDGNATCEADGTKTATCERCDAADTVTDEDSALGHSFLHYSSDGNATCEADGTKTATCERCDATDTVTDEDSALGHSFLHYVFDGNATCETDGTKTSNCERCTATDTVTDEGSILPHCFVNNVCTVCGALENPLLPSGIGDFTMTSGQSGALQLSLTVANETTAISLSDHITVYEGCDWFLSADEAGTQTLSRDSVLLNVGTQTFYLTVVCENSRAVYPVTIHRLNSFEYVFTVDDEEYLPPVSIDNPISIGKPADPVKNGYRFICWAVKGSPVSFPYYVSDSTVFAALWEPLSYSITYVENGADGTVQNPATYTIEDSVSLMPLNRSGYSFAGWFTDNALTVPANGIPKGSTGNKIFYAKWVPVSYPISYVLNGGENAIANPAEYTIEDAFDLAAPIKAGFDFAGWHSDAGFSSPCSAILKGTTGSKTFYAKWTPISYPIRYVLNGGTQNDANPSYYTVDDALTFAAPTRTGYLFAGWFADEALTVACGSIAKGSMGEMTVYAKWNATAYSITYILPNGESTDINPKTYTAEDTFTLIAPAKTGYTFDGWYADEAMTELCNAVLKGSTGNKTFYGKWTLTSYTLKYDLNGGKVLKKNPSTYTVEDTITLNTPARSGYLFEGWFSDSALTVPASQTIPKGSVGDRTFYAKWSPRTYTVRYVLNGGFNAASNPTSYTVGDPEIVLAAPTRSGYIFDGWYSDSAFEKPLDRIVSGTIGNQTFYAKFICAGQHTYSLGSQSTGSAVLFCLYCSEHITVTSPLHYSTFGAIGDGVKDDSAAIRMTHEFANRLHYDVEADAGKTYYIPKIDQAAVIKTNTDWKDATFIIDDTKVSHLDGTARTREIFEIHPDTPSKTLSVPANMTISKG